MFTFFNNFKLKILQINTVENNITYHIEDRITEDIEKKTITKKEVSDILYTMDLCKIFSDELKVVHWLYLNKEINEYNQVRLKGFNINKDFMVSCNKESNNIKYVIKLFSYISKYDNFIKKDRNNFITTWSELYELLGIHSGNTRHSFKSLMENTNFIRKVKVVGKGNRLVVNPFLYRHSVYIDTPTISYFIDFVEKDKSEIYFSNFMKIYLLINYEQGRTDMISSDVYYRLLRGNYE